MPSSGMHQSFTDTLTCKLVFRQLPHVCRRFSVLSVDCVARGLGASFLYKCPASRSGALRQHGFLVVKLRHKHLKFLCGYAT